MNRANYLGLILAVAVLLRSGPAAEAQVAVPEDPPGTAVASDLPESDDASPAPAEPGALDEAPLLFPAESPFVPEEVLAIEPEPETLGDEFAPPETPLTGTFGATAGPASPTPAMIGDFFGRSGAAVRGAGPILRSFAFLRLDSDFTLEYPGEQVLVSIPNPGSGGVVGRTKIAENTSPIPRDRILFNYSFFDNVPLFPGGVGVSRFTPGFEKTLFCGRASFEVKIPMAVTLDSTVFQDGGTDLSHGEFGNLLLTYKHLIVQRCNWAYSLGLSVAVPTADDGELRAADGTPLIRIENEAVHLLPFVGWLWTPNDCFFAHAFVQWDVEANPNPVFVNLDRRLRYVDDIHDATLQYVDVGLGYWTYQSCNRRQCLTGVAWTAELHWNRSLQENDAVEVGNLRVGDFSRNFELFDFTIGAHFEFYGRTLLTVGYSTPLGGGRDQQYDGELRVLVNRRFGPQSRLTRTPSLL